MILLGEPGATRLGTQTNLLPGGRELPQRHGKIVLVSKARGGKVYVNPGGLFSADPNLASRLLASTPPTDGKGTPWRALTISRSFSDSNPKFDFTVLLLLGFRPGLQRCSPCRSCPLGVNQGQGVFGIERVPAGGLLPHTAEDNVHAAVLGQDNLLHIAAQKELLPILRS